MFDVNTTKVIDFKGFKMKTGNMRVDSGGSFSYVKSVLINFI